ncbi:Crp/Fnr family transcriptional regulator [Wukongibacter baidiensis]|uniref:Crp/Fnr family transcriptional regulator n=1 Tax=Wukongibacter baidiensis TaxID=1723361 RepID=UPI003D7F5C83
MFYTDQIHQKKIIDLFPKNHVQEWLKHGKELSFHKGELITMPEKNLSNIYLIKTGNVSVFHIHVDGKECILSILSQDDFIGLLDVFTQDHSSVFAKALTDVTVIAIPKDEIRRVVESTPSLAMALINYFSRKYQETTDILIQVAYGKVEERLIFLLKKLAASNEEDNGWYPIPISITHKDLAGMVASTRETVTLLVNKLIKTGVIRQHQNRIWIQIEE